MPWTNPGLTCANALRHRRRHCDMENMGSTKDVRPSINKRYKVLMGRYTMKDHEDILHILVAQILFCSFSVKR